MTQILSEGTLSYLVDYCTVNGEIAGYLRSPVHTVPDTVPVHTVWYEKYE
jgi:hypothetical protein